MKEKYVSLIIPVYNVAHYLPRLFKSIINLNYHSFEVIFVNDGSTDNSLELLEEFSAKDVNKYRVVNKKNSGLNPARKSGLDVARYDYIMFADSDDYFDSDYISSLVKYIDKGDIVCAPLITENDDGGTISILNESDDELIVWNTIFALKKLYGNYEVGNFLPSKLFKKSVLFNVDFSYHRPFEDYTIMHVIFNNANAVVKIKKSTYHYVKHVGSLSAKSKQSYFSCIDALLMRRKWTIDNYQDNRELLFLNDDALFDRFVQISSAYYVGKKNKYYKIMKGIYGWNISKRKLNRYCMNNLPFYFKSPLIYLLVKKTIMIIKKYDSRRNIKQTIR